MLILMLENPSDDSVEMASDFTKEVGAYLQEVTPSGLHRWGQGGGVGGGEGFHAEWGGYDWACFGASTGEGRGRIHTLFTEGCVEKTSG